MGFFLSINPAHAADSTKLLSVSCSHLGRYSGLPYAAWGLFLTLLNREDRPIQLATPRAQSRLDNFARASRKHIQVCVYNERGYIVWLISVMISAAHVLLAINRLPSEFQLSLKMKMSNEMERCCVSSVTDMRDSSEVHHRHDEAHSRAHATEKQDVVTYLGTIRCNTWTKWNMDSLPRGPRTLCTRHALLDSLAASQVDRSPRPSKLRPSVTKNRDIVWRVSSNSSVPCSWRMVRVESNIIDRGSVPRRQKEHGGQVPPGVGQGSSPSVAAGDL